MMERQKILEVEKKLNRCFHETNAELIGLYRADGGHINDPMFINLNRVKDSIYRALFNIEMIKQEWRFADAEAEV